MKSAQVCSPAHHLDPAHTSTTNDPPLGIAHGSHVASRYERSRSKALELFAQRGFGQVSMRDLASHLGMNAGSLYHHFPSKQHLLFELLEEFYEDLGAILEDCARSQEEPANALLLFIRARLALHHEHPYHGRLAQRDTVSLDGERRQMIGEMKGQFGINLMRLMGLTTRETDPKLDAAGHAVAQLIINLPDWLEGHPLSEVEREHVAELLIMGMVNRLCLRSSAAC